MLPVHSFNVVPKLPEPLEPLREIALNLWWTWQPDARRLFRHLDPDLWHRTNHSPLRMLQLSKQARLQEVAADEDSDSNAVRTSVTGWKWISSMP